MGTCDTTYKCTFGLLRGLRGFISTVIVGVIRVISAHEPPSRVLTRAWFFESPAQRATVHYPSKQDSFEEA